MAWEAEQLVASPSVRRIIKDHGGTAGRVRACIAKCCSVQHVEYQ